MPAVVEKIENWIESAKEKVKVFEEQKKDNIPVEKDKLQTFDQELDSIQSSINVAIKEESLETEEKRKLRSCYFIAEKMWRITQLLHPNDKEEFQQALWWFIQNGGRNELSTIQIVRANPPYNDLELKELLEKAHKEVELRLFAEGVYQVFCSEAEIKQLCQQLDLEIVVIESYDAFVIISVDEETIAQIKRQYLVEKLESQSLPEFTKNSGETPMSKKEQIVKFKFPVREDWKQRIKDTNAKILQPLGNSEFVVSVPNLETLAQIKNFREIASVTPYEPTIRVQEKYLEGLGEEVTEEMLAEARLKLIDNPQAAESSNIIPGILIASFFTEEDCNQAIKTIESQGIDIVEQPDTNEFIVDLINYSNPMNAYEIIKNLPGLTFLEEETIETN